MTEWIMFRIAASNTYWSRSGQTLGATGPNLPCNVLIHFVVSICIQSAYSFLVGFGVAVSLLHPSPLLSLCWVTLTQTATFMLPPCYIITYGKLHGTNLSWVYVHKAVLPYLYGSQNMTRGSPMYMGHTKYVGLARTVHTKISGYAI